MMRMRQAIEVAASLNAFTLGCPLSRPRCYAARLRSSANMPPTVRLSETSTFDMSAGSGVSEDVRPMVSPNATTKRFQTRELVG
jgi:hypothetical protein